MPAAPTSRTLLVLVDGAPLPEEEARAFWARFSAHMEEKRGDLAGFARAEGFASVHPEVRDGAPALVVSRTAPQRAYANAARSGGGGSANVHSSPTSGAPAHGGARIGKKSRGKKR